jgi:NO-binding membrane sensor protein with MHYT domain
MSETAFGLVTPVVAYITACSGSAIALRSVRWALASEGKRRRNWLAVASVALGAGIWAMHFVAMLGFSVSGMDIRYNLAETGLSLVVAVAVVAVGIFTVGYGRRRFLRLLAGGLATGVGVACMHYLGMAAMRMTGLVVYDRKTVGLSVLIAVVAATAALWATLYVRGRWAVLGASLVMGLAVCAMHYTGMAAVSVHEQALADQNVVEGTSALTFIVPLFLGLGLSTFINFISLGYAPPVERPDLAPSTAPAPAPLPDPVLGPAAAELRQVVRL